MNEEFIPIDSPNNEQTTTEEPIIEIPVVPEEPVIETVYLADPELLEKIDDLMLHQQDTSTLLIFLIAMIGGIVFCKSLLKGWLDA